MDHIDYNGVCRVSITVSVSLPDFNGFHLFWGSNGTLNAGVGLASFLQKFATFHCFYTSLNISLKVGYARTCCSLLPKSTAAIGGARTLKDAPHWLKGLHLLIQQSSTLSIRTGLWNSGHIEPPYISSRIIIAFPSVRCRPISSSSSRNKGHIWGRK